MTRKSHFERFDEHTRLKHFLVDAYLKQWATILLPGRIKSRGSQARVWFVDAFAGAGRDSAGTPGSPVIAAQIAQAVNAKYFPGGPTKSSGMHVLAMEVDQYRANQLTENLREFKREPPFVHVRHGELRAVLTLFLGHVGNDPVLYFLDPFGVEGLDAGMLADLLKGPQAEVLLLFFDEGAVRLAGKAAATVPSRDVLLADRQRGPTIFDEEFTEQDAEADRAAVERILAGHQSNDRAREILDRAFGGSWWRPVIDAAPAPLRREKFVDLYAELLKTSGASHVLPFTVTSPKGRHKYTLLHASKHKRPYAVMKDAMDRTRRRVQGQAAPTLFEAGPDAGLMTIESKADFGAAVTAVLRNFAGRRVRFTHPKYTEESVERFAIDETPLLKHELKALRAELERRGLAVRHAEGGSRAVEFDFPVVE